MRLARLGMPLSLTVALLGCNVRPVPGPIAGNEAAQSIVAGAPASERALQVSFKFGPSSGRSTLAAKADIDHITLGLKQGTLPERTQTVPKSAINQSTGTATATFYSLSADPATVTATAFDANGNAIGSSSTTVTVSTTAITVAALTIQLDPTIVYQTGVPYTNGGVTSSFVGSGRAGYIDGTGIGADFRNPFGLAMDSAGVLFVADQGNHAIRKITPDRVVTTLAGGSGPGYADGQGSNAKFKDPAFLTFGPDGMLYVTEINNHRIRKITPSGLVTTLAGSGVGGYANGQGASAQFYGPSGIAVDESNNVYVSDFYNQRIRKIDPSGNVTLVAGNGIAGWSDGTFTDSMFSNPHGLAYRAGNLYVADYSNSKLRKVSTTGAVQTIATFTPGSYRRPVGVAMDGSGILYVGFQTDILSGPPGVDPSLLAGWYGYGGYAEGTGKSAVINGPYGIAIAPNGPIYVADNGNNRIRKIQ